MTKTDVELQCTILSDIDGVLLRHFGDIEAILTNPPEVLPGVKEALQDWNLKDYRVVLTTGRRESMREFTEKQLKDCGITYDVLVMGCRRGCRIVINDRKPNSDQDTCRAINVDRNKGLMGIEI